MSPAARGSPMSPPEQQEMLGLHTAHTVHRPVLKSLPCNSVHCTGTSVIESVPGEQEKEEERLLAHCTLAQGEAH